MPDRPILRRRMPLLPPKKKSREKLWAEYCEAQSHMTHDEIREWNRRAFSFSPPRSRGWRREYHGREWIFYYPKLASGRWSRRPITIYAPYTNLYQCRMCKKWSTPHNVHSRWFDWRYSRKDTEDLYFKYGKFCMGCWNKANAHNVRLDAYECNKDTLKVLRREIRETATKER